MRKSHITLRIDAKNLEKLKLEAQQKNLSVNVLINQILDLYASWYAYAPQAGIIPILKDLPRLLLENHTYPDIEKIAKKISLDKTKDVALLLSAEFNYDSFVALIITWLKVSGFPYKYEKSDSIHKLIMQFDMGKKWSFFITKCYEGIFEAMGGVKIESEITENTVIMTIRK
jgi:hypothetical protein